MPFSIAAAPAVASGCCPRASRFTTPATPLPDSPASQRFPAAARLRSNAEFQTVRADGRTAQGRFLRMTALQRPDEEPARLGIVTSRRVGNAVQRSLARRRLREIFRVRRAQLVPGLWLVVVAKAGSAIATFDELRDEWLRLAARLSILRTL